MRTSMSTAAHALSRRQVLVALGALAGVNLAFAQGYPSRPVRLIVPAPAGTSPDVMARAWGEAFARATGQPVVVENKPGASTMIAAQAVAGAPADGYTLLYTFNNTFSINPWVFRKMPYKDSFLTDLMGQRVDVAFDASTGAIAQVRAGKLRALAVSSARRIEALPEVPAIAETYPGFVGDSWHGLFAPRGTPAVVVAALEAQTQRIVAAPEFQASLREVSLTPVGSSAEQFRQFLAADAQAWGQVVRDNGIRLD